MVLPQTATASRDDHGYCGAAALAGAADAGVAETESVPTIADNPATRTTTARRRRDSFEGRLDIEILRLPTKGRCFPGATAM
jgi:hypothetical protein